MGRPLVDLTTLVVVHMALVVDIQGTVGVHRHDHLSDVRVDLTLVEPAEDKGVGLDLAYMAYGEFRDTSQTLQAYVIGLRPMPS